MNEKHLTQHKTVKKEKGFCIKLIVSVENEEIREGMTLPDRLR